MADETKKTPHEDGVDFVKDKKKSKGIPVFLIVSACVLVVALAVSMLLLMGYEDSVVRVMDYGTVLQGVSVGGVDISGMTEEEALDTTASIPEALLAAVNISVDINGDIHQLTAEDIGVYTDYDDIMAQAIAYGHSGTFEDRKTAAETAKSDGVDFPVQTLIDESAVAAASQRMKDELDAEPQEAGFVFMPSGYYLIDGEPVTPEEYEAMKTAAEEADAEFQELELVRLTEEEKPNPLRYQFYQDTKFKEDYIPPDADIARFYYTEPKTGLVIDTDALTAMIIDEVGSGNYEMITASVEVTEPETTLEDIKNQTQLISSWTSSYASHYGSNRNYNVWKLSGIINGVIIQPDEEWSINEEAGPRTYSRGWKGAPGISGGAFVTEAGGGVCQVSSTVYNAAIRSALDITDFSHHSVVSGYIPIGLDATISTGAPDLKMRNPNETPIYLVSYYNKEDRNITVEFYGTPVVHEEYGEVILDFTSKQTGTGPTPKTVKHYGATSAPDGTSIAPGKSYTYIHARGAKYADVFIHYYDLEGNELRDKELYEEASYRSSVGHVYVNDADPDATPKPTEKPTTKPTTEPTTKPTTKPTTEPTTEEPDDDDGDGGDEE